MMARILAFAVSAFLVLSAATAQSGSPRTLAAPDELQVHFLDVGQGDCAVGPDRDCGDFQTWQDAQDFYQAVALAGYTRDPHRLDPDGDGIPVRELTWGALKTVRATRIERPRRCI